jgi:uncharacterized protein (TIGR03437 family)
MHLHKPSGAIRFAIRSTAIVLAMTGAAFAASTILAGTMQGLVKSTDGGTTWQLLTTASANPLLSGASNFGSVAVHPRNPNIWYALGGGSSNGFFQSTDRGQTWTGHPLIGFQPDRGPGTLAGDAALTNVAYVVAKATSGFIVKTSDSGATWTKLKLPNTNYYSPATFPDGADVTNIAADPLLSGVVYAVASAYLFKSSDFGSTWTVLSTGVDTPEAPNNRGGLDVGFPYLARVTVDPRDGRVLYASARSNVVDPRCKASLSSQCGLYRSADGGVTWTTLGLPAPAAHSISLGAASGEIYVGADVAGLGGSILKSTDSGQTFVPLKNGFSTVFGPFVWADPNASSVAYALENFTGLYDGNLYRSTDSGTTWADIQLDFCKFTPGCKQSFAPQIEDLVIVPDAAGAVTGPAPLISQNGVVNAAGFQTGIVPGSWATIFGSNLAPSADDWSKSIVNGKFPTSLDGVSVTVAGKPAYVYYITPTQLNVLVPSVATGPVPITVTTPSGVSATFTATAATYAPAFFAWPNHQPVATRQDFTFAAASNTFAGASTVSAKPGEVLILWGTGFGPTSPAAPDGSAVPANATYSTTTLPTVTINNLPATVYGAALAPGFGGLYQVAIQVPGSLADGDWPVQAAIGGVPSPSNLTLSIRH